jgi:hypothetical protein
VNARSPAVGAFDALSPEELLALEYEAKVKLLQYVAAELLVLRISYAKAAAEYADLSGQLRVLTEVKGALQLALEAEADRRIA